MFTGLIALILSLCALQVAQSKVYKDGVSLVLYIISGTLLVAGAMHITGAEKSIGDYLAVQSYTCAH